MNDHSLIVMNGLSVLQVVAVLRYCWLVRIEFQHATIIHHPQNEPRGVASQPAVSVLDPFHTKLYSIDQLTVVLTQ